MGKTEGRLGYVDWDEIVIVSENNIKICEANIRKGERGLILENMALDFAIKERDKFEKPEIMAEENKPEETPETPETPEKEE